MRSASTSAESRKATLRTRARGMLRALGGLRRPRHSIAGRLMSLVLATTTLALTVAGVALLLTDLSDNRRGWVDDLMTEASILALATAPALSFDDRSAAARNLTALQARQSIEAAALYSPDGALYAEFTRGRARVPAQLPPLTPGAHVDRQRVELLHPVRQSGETLGFIYLQAQYDVSARVQAYASILALVLALSLAVALLASGWLQRVVTEPMDSIASVAQGIVERRDYSLRAKKITQDEMGLVVDAFNSMLDEVEARTRSLEESNAALKQQAAERLLAERAARESEQLYRAIGESIEYGVWVADAEGRCTYLSDSFLRLIGMTQEQVAVYGEQTLHPQERESAMAAWRECVRTGTNWYGEHRILGRDGRYHAVLSQGVPIRDETGRIIRWAGINLDIRRLKETERALREADRRKDEFLATLAHELRNPLAPIRTAVQLLEMPSADERQRRWGRDVIARQVRNMALLLDDLLDVSRITRGRLALKKELVELRAVVESAVETARPMIEAKRHALSLHLPPGQLMLEVDSLRLSQVLANLLTNAAKYTDPEGQIVLRAQATSSGLTLSVKDTGIGLAPESIPHLFTMFSQVDTSIDRTQGGLGIGLSLVKGLISLHGGTIEANSEGLGHGSEFIVRLPATALAGARPLERDKLAQEIKVAQPALSTVIVADDNREAAQTLSAVLTLSGYAATAVYSGSEALELGARLQPDAMLLDIGMPGMSGYETARRIRAEAWGRKLLLIAVTGWGQEDDKRKARTMGFDVHLTKPADPNEVERILASHLAGRHTSIERA